MVQRTVKKVINTGNAASEAEELFLPTPEELEESPDLSLLNLLADLGEDTEQVKVQIYQRDANTKKEAWIFDCSPLEFSFSDIQSIYGPGEYRVRVTGPIPGSNYIGMRSNKVHIIGAPRNGIKKLEQSQNNNIDAALERMAKMIADQNAANQKFMMDMMIAQSASKSNPIEDFRNIASALGALPQRQEQPDMFSQFERFASMMKMLKGDAMPVNEDGAIDGGSMVMAKGLEVLGGIVQAMNNKPVIAQNPAPRATPQLPHVAPAIMPKQPEQNIAPIQEIKQPEKLTPEQEEMNLMLRYQINQIIKAAANNEDIEQFAGLIYEHAPDDFFDDLNKPNWFDLLVKIDSRIADHRAWFEKLHARIIEISLTPDDDDDITGESQSTGPTNGDIPSGNAAT